MSVTTIAQLAQSGATSSSKALPQRLKLCGVNETLDVDVTIFDMVLHLPSWQCQGPSWRGGRTQHPLLPKPLLGNMFRAQVCPCLKTAGE